jgi:uncharacterized membrane protein YhaH (DUF805 family)
MSWTQYLFSFRGRISRSGFWLFFFVVQLVAQIAYFAVASAINFLWTGSFDLDQAGTFESVILTILALPFLPITIISPLAIWTKRLHDRNKSGWWQITYAVSLALVISVVAMHDDHLISGIIFYLCATIAAISYAVLIWICVETAFIRGTPGDNRFGPDPLAPSR